MSKIGHITIAGQPIIGRTPTGYVHPDKPGEAPLEKLEDVIIRLKEKKQMKQSSDIYILSCDILDLGEGEYKCHSHGCCWIDYIHKQPFRFEQCPIRALYIIHDELASIPDDVLHWVIDPLYIAKPYGEDDV